MDMNEMLESENKLGAKLRIVPNPYQPERDGPLRLLGTDRRGKPAKIYGDEEFICKMLSILAEEARMYSRPQ